MTRLLMIRVFALLLLPGYLLAQESENLYEGDNAQKFAAYLYETKQYPLAAREYERLRFVNPQDTFLQKRLIDSYAYSGQKSFAMSRLLSFYEQPLAMPASLGNTYTKLLYQDRAFKEMKQFTQGSLTLSQDEKWIWSGIQSYQLRDFDAASREISRINLENWANLQSLPGLIDNASKMKRKSPFVAGLFSTVIPGSGKFYTKNWADGVIAMIFIGTAAWQSYRGFNQNGINSRYGWIFGTLGTGYYLGNIYGSQKAAKIYNQKLYQDIDDRIEILVNSTF